MAAIEVAGPNETTYIMELFLWVLMSYLSIHQGFGLRGRRGPSTVANVEPGVLHSLLHEVTLLQLESGLVLLADSEELTQENQVVLLSIRSHAYMVNVCFHPSASGFEFLHYRFPT